jgi:hypothetical protein
MSEKLDSSNISVKSKVENQLAYKFGEISKLRTDRVGKIYS